MIKALIFFVLGAASIIFLIRAFVRSDASRVSRIVKIIIIRKLKIIELFRVKC